MVAVWRGLLCRGPGWEGLWEDRSPSAGGDRQAWKTGYNPTLLDLKSNNSDKVLVKDSRVCFHSVHLRFHGLRDLLPAQQGRPPPHH